MRVANLFDCFDRHLNNLDIISETEELFAAKVLEDFIINMSAIGFTMGYHAEDIYEDLQDDVISMLRKKTYGFYNLDDYRNYLREDRAA